ncbi:unnamed protein product [Penicillium salamii]|uniref:Ankyrin repeat-containing domain-containing protein n=1 Tax=Penicillium salamii TaxID=1612424 RepID=A0A9W4NNJ4_9EURO|nr:unnamed protein product [Penicillium salamii]CAG8383815.1 unnamed protein product [Penicillium salamii]CAG8387964.1 unnamed protein product [Penicillium salamii]CAG8402549.1 unnamed protein product [Penicillium salamii]CAG8566554.1 unnamed protein product [Penicillium salamii]
MHKKRVSLWFPIFWRAVMPHKSVRSMNALNLAAFNGHEQEVQFLLAIKKYDINAADKTRGNPLMWASRNGHNKIHGADVNAHGEYYGNALQAASSGGYDTIVQILLEHGADVNAQVSAQGGFHRSALQAASSRGHDNIVQMLLEHGADVKALESYHGSALQAASSGGHHKIEQMLLDPGADQSVRYRSPFKKLKNFMSRKKYRV